MIFPKIFSNECKARTRLQIFVSSSSKGGRLSHHTLLLSFDHGSNDVKSPNSVALILHMGFFFFQTSKQLHSDTVSLEIASNLTM